MVQCGLACTLRAQGGPGTVRAQTVVRRPALRVHSEDRQERLEPTNNRNYCSREQRDRQSVSPAQLRTSELTERGNRQLLLVTPLRPHSIPKAQG